MRAILELRLPAVAASATSAREAVESSLRGVLADRTVEDLKLVMSELVTNCIRHAGLTESQAITTRVLVQGETIRVEVCDPGPGFEPPGGRKAGTEHASGWGLYLVERLAQRWGIDRARNENRVWMEIDGTRNTVTNGV